MNGRVLPRPLSLAGLFALLLLALVNPVSAQHVVQEGLRQGVQRPASLLQMLQDDPGRFEFDNAWIQKLERVRANRDAQKQRRVLATRSRGGEMGKHRGLKIPRAKALAGSSPAPGITTIPTPLGISRGRSSHWLGRLHEDHLLRH